MFVRRAFFNWMFLAAAVLPIWPLISVGIFSGSGWTFLGLVVAMPILFIALLVVAFLIRARFDVRQQRAVSWVDVALLSVWHATIIAFGFFTPASAILATAGIIIGIAIFWFELWQLLRSAAERARAAMAEYEQMSRQPASPPRMPRPSEPAQVEEFIVIHEERRSGEAS
jgi:glucan phosphoethanolaminetransferase (alkaline phosphatase superfamily)